jgi:hypothetical protein
MNCREFRREHDAYVDDTLSGAAIEGMRNHLRFCAVCAQLDTRVRRALMLAHNLPLIQLSPEFSGRLKARLLDERARAHELRDTSVHTRSHARPLGLWRPLSMGAYAAVTAGMLAVAGLAGVLAFGAGSVTRDATIRLAPVVAQLPEPEPTVAWSSTSSPLTQSTMVASVPAGMPLWPAVFVAQQASWHLVSDAAER